MSLFGGQSGGFDFLIGGGEMGKRMRALDWTGTPLGDPSVWPQSLRSVLGICLNTAFPMAIYWGPELALLYNDAWSPIPGEKHPAALGKPGREVWPEIWTEIGPLFESVQHTGEGVWQQDQLLPMHRHGYTEECYFNFTFSPVRGEDGRVAGIFNAVIETTFRVIEERRLRMLRDLTAAAVVETVHAACHRLMAVLDSNGLDVPFASIYLMDPEGNAAQLAGRAGTHPEFLAPVRLTIEDTNPLSVGELIRTSQMQVVNLPAALTISTVSWPGELVHRLFCCPFRAREPAESLACS